MTSDRRRFLVSCTALALAPALMPLARAQQNPQREALLREVTGGAPLRVGRVLVDTPPLADNGHSVPLRIVVDSPMTATDHVTSIAVYNEKNPQREVARFMLGPRSGKASVSTRVRLATSQQLVAVAKLSDGSYWSDTIDVIVVLAACIEGEA